jgi:hypothetical protein
LGINFLHREKIDYIAYSYIGPCRSEKEVQEANQHIILADENAEANDFVLSSLKSSNDNLQC